ncbi:unnamed protein product [Amoebophrya sp. A25]|nr:unnamed protein product [Amoebophrya sp. A25]|eukprot:GSA25T00023774001.1
MMYYNMAQSSGTTTSGPSRSGNKSNSIIAPKGSQQMRNSIQDQSLIAGDVETSSVISGYPRTSRTTSSGLEHQGFTTSSRTIQESQRTQIDGHGGGGQSSFMATGAGAPPSGKVTPPNTSAQGGTIIGGGGGASSSSTGAPGGSSSLRGKVSSDRQATSGQQGAAASSANGSFLVTPRGVQEVRRNKGLRSKHSPNSLLGKTLLDALASTSGAGGNRSTILSKVAGSSAAGASPRSKELDVLLRGDRPVVRKF